MSFRFFLKKITSLSIPRAHAFRPWFPIGARFIQSCFQRILSLFLCMHMFHYQTEHLCRGPEDLPRENARALGKESLPRAWPSAKNSPRQSLSRARQAHGSNNSLPRAKPSVKGRPSATPPDTTSIPCRQSLPRASPLGPRQRLFNRFWKFSFKKVVAECPWTSTQQR